MATAARIATSLRLRALDALSRDPLVPPHRLRGFVGDSDFVATGDAFLESFVELGGLRPTDDVLDVGCGIGRMARPLAAFLTTGRYVGFDPSAEAIAWCQERYPANFAFVHADVANGMYNPAGTVAARAFSFPASDASVDFVVATSVFTHLLPADAEHYLAEVRRVLRPGGRALMTFFLGPSGGGEERVSTDAEWLADRLPGVVLHRGVGVQDVAVFTA